MIRVLIFLLFFYGCSPTVKNLDSKGKNIICFGNSITYGVGADEGKDYPSYLSRMVKRRIINAGVPSDTTKSAISRLKRDVLDKDPYLVVIELGGNDFLRKVPLKDTLNNLEEIIIRIQKKKSVVALCDISGGFVMAGYSPYLERIAKKHGVIFIPHLLEGIINNPRLKSDYIHPNSKGYRIIAHRVYRAIKPYLK